VPLADRAAVRGTAGHSLGEAAVDDGERAVAERVVVEVGVLAGQPGHQPHLLPLIAFDQHGKSLIWVIPQQMPPAVPVHGEFDGDADGVTQHGVFGDEERVVGNGEHECPQGI
jgi:hypothetical protein